MKDDNFQTLKSGFKIFNFLKLILYNLVTLDRVKMNSRRLPSRKKPLHLKKEREINKLFRLKFYLIKFFFHNLVIFQVFHV